MSILIKDMEMPKSCNECTMSIEHACMINGNIISDYWARLDRPTDCPLVELPPHGDLIDRDALYEKTAEWEAQALHMVEVTMNDEDTTKWKRWSTVLIERGAFKSDVANAPTIIEAEVIP